ncbi:MAG: methylmalonyl-CoA epimerase [Calditrichaeota bacterium]|nr:methylmalonyl-CoA epimerase [Calditrichota bacterium]MCB9366475.1 methylmalonyl-CoA epimerase [Calditrichota bacterium]MCB9391267.1 methylmalonyl-CoA epimerase [Calditrichota bacterium]
MFEQLDHIALAVPDLDKAIDNWKELTGAMLSHREFVESQNTHVAFLSLAGFRIELIAPGGPESTVAKYLEKRGPGLHHIALKCADGQSALNELAEKGARLINETLRPGAEQTMVGFVHPASLGGVLVEIVEHP